MGDQPLEAASGSRVSAGGHRCRGVQHADGAVLGGVLCAALTDRRAPTGFLDGAAATGALVGRYLQCGGEVAVAGVGQQQRRRPPGHALREGALQHDHRGLFGLGHLQCAVHGRFEALALRLVA